MSDDDPGMSVRIDEAGGEPKWGSKDRVVEYRGRGGVRRRFPVADLADMSLRLPCMVITALRSRWMVTRCRGGRSDLGGWVGDGRWGMCDGGWEMSRGIVYFS